MRFNVACMIIVFLYQCLYQIDCRTQISTDISIPQRNKLRKFSVFEQKHTIKISQAFNIRKKMQQEVEQQMISLKERMLAERQRKKINDYLVPNAGQTSFMKDLINRF